MIGKTLSLSLKLFTTWILLLAFFILIGDFIFGADTNFNLLSFSNWDGRHFLDIAKYGYLQNIQYAFFPLYPLLTNSLAKISQGNYLLSGLLVNLLSTLGIIYYFLKLLKNEKNSLKILISFLIFPTSFYLISFYSEAVFLLFTLMSFFYTKNKNYYLGALFASLSSITRVTGIAVILFFFYEIYRSQKSLPEKILFFLISISSFSLYCIYMFLNTGNPFYFLVSEITWDRVVTIPGFNIFVVIEYIARHGVKPESFTILFDLLFTIFGLGIGIKVWKNLKPAFSIYTWSSLILPLTTALLLSMPRFILVIFPLFIAMAQIKNRIFNISYFVTCLTLLFLFFNFFLRHIWVS